MTCELDILAAYSDNCTGDNINGYTANWNIGFRVIDPFDTSISFQQNNGTILTATLTGLTDTLVIPNIAADGGIYDTLKVWFTNDIACADMIVVKRPLPCAADVSACSSASGCLGGNSFDDLNCNGIKDTELGVAGIQVNISDCDNNTTTVYTDSDGDWEVCGLTDGEQYRVEFVMPKRISCWAKPTHTGNDNGSDVQFVTVPTCANFGLSNASDYCEENPDLATPCYVNGDPLAGGTSGGLDAFVSFPYNSNGNSVNPNHLAFANEIGATWGVAYQRTSKTIFTSAVIKRHVGLGDVTGDAVGDIGGIWTIDPATALVTKWLDVASLGVNLGTDPHTGLGADWVDTSYDELTFDAVGKRGIGDIDISEDGKRLYVMNLNDKELLEIDIASKSLLNSYPINNPGCGDMADVRPWGIEIHHGEIYIGVVCSGQSTGNRADVSAHVMQLDQSDNTFYNVLSLDDMTYLRGQDVPAGDSTDDLSVEAWFAWTDQWNPGRKTFNPERVYYAQPILSDIEFTENGDMVIAFLDRSGMQGGQDNFSIDTNDPNLYATTSAGSVLKACWDGSIWNIEENGICGGTVGYGTGTFGPGGGEFFEDEYPGGGHTERFLGAVAYRMGSDTLIGTAFNPMNASYSGGTFGVSVATGLRQTRYEVYEDSQDGTFAKATGLGDIEVLCGAAPLEIGNYVWCDSLKNGLQDACERGIDGLNVQLYNCLLYTSPSPRDTLLSRMPSSA